MGERYLHHNVRTELFNKVYVYNCSYTWLDKGDGGSEGREEVSILKTYEEARDETMELVVGGLPRQEECGDGSKYTSIDVDMGEAFLLSLVIVSEEIKYGHLMRLKTGELFDKLWVRMYPYDSTKEQWQHLTDVKPMMFRKWSE